MNRHENKILLDLRHIGINRIFVNRLSYQKRFQYYKQHCQ